MFAPVSIAFSRLAFSKTAQNYKDQNGYGFELDSELKPLDALTLRGNIAYQRSRDANTRQLTAEAPGIQAYVGATWRFLPDWTFDSRYYWIADRRRADGDNRPDIANYSKVDLTVRRKNIARHWEAAMAVRNLMNDDIREPGPALIVPGDYPMEGRSLWGEIRYRF